MNDASSPLMHVLHVPYTYHPDPVGGTEVYVAALARELRAHGVASTITAPGRDADAYEHQGVTVHRYRVGAAPDLRALHGAGDPEAARGFARVLDAVHPDVVHLHALTSGVSLLGLREAKRRGVPVVFTYHTPTVSCPRGTLLRQDGRVCDGSLTVHRCATCVLASRGVPAPLAAAAAAIPTGVGAALGALGARGGAWTAARLPELTELRQASYRQLIGAADHVVAPCAWVYELLRRHGVSPGRLSLSRQGLAAPADGKAVDRSRVDGRRGNTPIRLAFFGRLDPVKGVDLVVAALRMMPKLPLDLHVFGVGGDGAAQGYGNVLRSAAAGDTRIHFRPAVASDQVVALLRGFDALVVPSRGLETGPLVVLEAFAAGIPVIGARLGGIKELVRHDVDGLLVDPDSAPAWGQVLQAAATDRSVLLRLQAGVRPPRTMADAAADMAQVYARLQGEPALAMAEAGVHS